MRMIARREGLGDVLAEGVRRAVERLGPEAATVGVYTRKGSTPRGHDHRARWTEMFDTSISESGALDNTLMVADPTQFGLPPRTDPFDPDALSRAEAKMKGAMQFEDSMVTCRFNTQTDVQQLAAAVAATTGWDFTFEEAMAVGRRAVNLMRAYNVQAGLTADLDRPGPRYGSTAPDGPAAGKAIGEHFERMVRDYYALMGWDERGRPLPSTLRALQLDAVTADLERVA
jgi:aldehyde:ferredoxin oxidoreductase